MLDNNDLAMIREIVRDVLREVREDNDRRTREIVDACIERDMPDIIERHELTCAHGKAVSWYKAYIAGMGSIAGFLGALIMLVLQTIVRNLMTK